MQTTLENLTKSLDLLATKLDILTKNLALNAPKKPTTINWTANYTGIWKNNCIINSNAAINTDLNVLHGLDDKIVKLEKNIKSFLDHGIYNHVLLTGARGMGKSSLIAGLLNKYKDYGLRLIQVNRKELSNLDELFLQLQNSSAYKFIVFFDDLSFEKNDLDYKNLKSILDNGLNLVPQNVCIIATSNRKHLLPQTMQDNLEGIEQINGDFDLRPKETLEESLSLADRFGLWLNFYGFDQENYLIAVQKWLNILSKPKAIELDEQLNLAAIQFATSRGARNGRIAKQFAIYYLSNLTD